MHLADRAAISTADYRVGERGDGRDRAANGHDRDLIHVCLTATVPGWFRTDKTRRAIIARRQRTGQRAVRSMRTNLQSRTARRPGLGLCLLCPPASRVA